MMRITANHDAQPNTTTMRVEGRIVGDWVDLLDSECRSELKRGRRLILDFSGVVGLDDRARQVLKALRGEGVRITNQPRLLKLEEHDR